MQELKEKEVKSFDEIYQRYYTSISFYIKVHIKNFHDAEDLVSEIFETAFRAYPNYDPEKSSVSTWLYVIAKSRLKNFYRKKGGELLDIAEINENLLVTEEERSDMEIAEAYQQLRDMLASSLEILDERSCKAVIMKYLLNYTGEEVAAAIGTTSGNTRVLLFRALRKMKQHLQKELKNWEEYING